MLRNRLFVYLSAALIAATLAKDAGARIPDEVRPQAETCLAEVTPACLLDLAVSLAHTAPASSVELSWFSSAITERQFKIGNFAAGAELAAAFEPSSLLDLVESHASALRGADPALLAPIHRAAEAHLQAARAERDPVALGVQAEAVRILVASGAIGRAAEVLAEAVERFRTGLAAEHASFIRVCGALGEAAVALRDREVGEAFVMAVVGPDWRADRDPFELVAENCLASVGTVLAAVGDPDGAIAAWRALGGAGKSSCCDSRCNPAIARQGESSCGLHLRRGALRRNAGEHLRYDSRAAGNGSGLRYRQARFRRPSRRG